jgi:hypothetical protein
LEAMRPWPMGPASANDRQGNFSLSIASLRFLTP